MSRGSLVNTSIGDYRLDRFLGAGGMGEVYRATHLRLGRAAAIKVLSPEGPGASFVQRFWNEARLHATLHHPNIVELYDFLEHRGQLCIVMEYVDGETLSDRVRLGGALPPAEAIAVLTGITAAVAYLHSQGIVHRDIKSANVRLVSSGGAKLLDFGIAKGGSTPALTGAGAVIGTLVYLAPEQLRGEPASPQSDVWALGLLLYEMLTGRLPFKGDTARELLDTIGKATFVRASALAPGGGGVGPAWRACDRIITRCLQRDPVDRFVDAGDVLAELATVAPAEPPSAVPPLVHAPLPPRKRALQVAELAGWARFGVTRLLGAAERYWAWLAAAAAVSVLLLVLVVMATRAGPSPPSPSPVQKPGRGAARAGATATRPPPVAPRSSHRIEVVGGAADVYVNGTRQGRTPFDYEADPHETIRLELRRDGFVTVVETFDVTTRPVWTFVMRRAEGRLP